MEYLSNKSVAKTTFAIILAAIAWFAIALQLHLTTGSIANFFSYFTILCNLLIAVSLSFSSLKATYKLGLFFTKVSVQSAIGLYINSATLIGNSTYIAI